MYPWCQLGLGGLAIPELERRLNFGREQARAAVIALGKLPKGVALPLVEKAFRDSYPAVRYYAAEYLVNNSSSEGHALAIKRLEVETDRDTRKLLERA
jgi:hypothetical protein